MDEYDDEFEEYGEKEKKMGFLDMFDKIDDIIYKPVEAVSNWINEPLKKFEHKREMENEQNRAVIEEEKLRLEAELEQQRIRADAELAADQRRWNAEIDQMIAEQEDARRDKLVESIKRYQIDLANASRDIINSIGEMSLELRKKANELVQEKTNDYITLQKKATNDATQKLIEIGERFANNERVRIRMEDSVIDNMDAVINHANNFITELSEDIKRLNQNIDTLARESVNNINKQLAPLTNSLGQSLEYHSDSIQIEDKTIVDLSKDDIKEIDFEE